MLDKTISRNHAELIKKNHKYYLLDMNSKFGTQILLKDKI